MYNATLQKDIRDYTYNATIFYSTVNQCVKLHLDDQLNANIEGLCPSLKQSLKGGI